MEVDLTSPHRSAAAILAVASMANMTHKAVIGRQLLTVDLDVWDDADILKRSDSQSPISVLDAFKGVHR